MVLQKIRDPVSSLTHLAGAIAGAICTVALLYKAVPFGARYLAAFGIFGTTLVLLYTTSAIYHMPKITGKSLQVLRRLDHSMIFFLIAGTYTPTCLIPLRGPWGWSILAVVWGLALAGTFMKIFWIQAPRLLSTAIYVIMGWIVVVAFYPLLNAVSATAFAFLLTGGLLYTLGAVIYALKWPPLPFKWFGFHDLFHVFVLLGSTFHVLFMFQLYPD